MAQEQSGTLVPITGLHLAPQTPDSYGGFSFDRDASIWLPSPDFWLVKPNKPIDTPINSLGLVDIEATIIAVKQTIDPSFDWIKYGGSDSTHHFYHPASDYSYSETWGKGRHVFNEGSFRELPIHKGELPRVFENWLHIITLAPPKPSKEVMENRLEGYRVAKSFFRSVRQAIQLQRRSDRYFKDIAEATDKHNSTDDGEFAKDYVARIIEKHLKSVEMHKKELENIPPEFRLIEPDDNPHKLAKNLGRFITRRSMKLGRKVYEPLAA